MDPGAAIDDGWSMSLDVRGEEDVPVSVAEADRFFIEEFITSGENDADADADADADINVDTNDDADNTNR